MLTLSYFFPFWRRSNQYVSFLESAYIRHVWHTNLTPATKLMKTRVFWGMTPCLLVNIYGRFEVADCFYFQRNLIVSIDMVWYSKRLESLSAQLWEYRISNWNSVYCVPSKLDIYYNLPQKKQFSLMKYHKCRHTCLRMSCLLKVTYKENPETSFSVSSFTAPSPLFHTSHIPVMH